MEQKQPTIEELAEQLEKVNNELNQLNEELYDVRSKLKPLIDKDDQADYVTDIFQRPSSTYMQEYRKLNAKLNNLVEKIEEFEQQRDEIQQEIDKQQNETHPNIVNDYTNESDNKKTKLEPQGGGDVQNEIIKKAQNLYEKNRQKLQGRIGKINKFDASIYKIKQKPNENTDTKKNQLLIALIEEKKRIFLKYWEILMINKYKLKLNEKYNIDNPTEGKQQFFKKKEKLTKKCKEEWNKNRKEMVEQYLKQKFTQAMEQKFGTNWQEKIEKFTQEMEQKFGTNWQEKITQEMEQKFGTNWQEKFKQEMEQMQNEEDDFIERKIREINDVYDKQYYSELQKYKKQNNNQKSQPTVFSEDEQYENNTVKSYIQYDNIEEQWKQQKGKKYGETINILGVQSEEPMKPTEPMKLTELTKSEQAKFRQQEKNRGKSIGYQTPL